MFVSFTRSPLIYKLRAAAFQMNCWLVHQGSMYTVFTVKEREKKCFLLMFCLVHLMFVHIIHNKSQCIFIYLNWCQKSLPSNRGWLLVPFYVHDWAVDFLHNWFDYQPIKMSAAMWFLVQDHNAEYRKLSILAYHAFTLHKHLPDRHYYFYKYSCKQA